MSLKHKGKGPQAMTANRLREGDCVWLDADLSWTTDWARALRTEDVRYIERMAEAAQRDADANLVVGHYFIDVEPDTGLPARYREKFRTRGPSYDTAELL